MRRAVNPICVVVAGALATIPASHAASSGLAAGLLSLLGIMIMINVAEWVVFGRD